MDKEQIRLVQAILYALYIKEYIDKHLEPTQWRKYVSDMLTDLI